MTQPITPDNCKICQENPLLCSRIHYWPTDTHDTPTSCKTCGRENIVNWDGQGHCITCTRDRILGDTNSDVLDEILEQFLNDRFETQRLPDGWVITREHRTKFTQAINQYMLDTFIELITEAPGYFDEDLVKAWVDEAELIKTAKERLRP